MAMSEDSSATQGNPRLRRLSLLKKTDIVFRIRLDLALSPGLAGEDLERFFRRFCCPCGRKFSKENPPNFCLRRPSKPFPAVPGPFLAPHISLDPLYYGSGLSSTPRTLPYPRAYPDCTPIDWATRSVILVWIWLDSFSYGFGTLESRKSVSGKHGRWTNRKPHLHGRRNDGLWFLGRNAKISLGPLPVQSFNDSEEQKTRI